MIRSSRATVLLAALTTSLFACGASEEDVGNGSADLTSGAVDRDHTGVVKIYIHKRDATGALVAGPTASGFLVTPTLVVTARHVVSFLGAPTATCPLGTTTPPTPDLPTRLLVTNALTPEDDLRSANVKAIFVPPQTDGVDICGNDLAVIELAAPIPGAVLIAPRLDAAPVVGAPLTLSSYGTTGPSTEPSKTRLERTVKVMDLEHSDGAEAFKFLPAKELATTGACPGDSGGPALGSDGRAIGVSSRGEQTCTVAIYARLDVAAAWLRSQAVGASNRAGTAIPPWAK